MSSEEIKCKGCNRLVENIYRFCPHCGMSLGLLEEKMKFERPQDLKKDLEQNVDEFGKEVSQVEGIRRIIDSKDPQIIEKERERTSEVLEQFPILKKRIEDESEKTFKMFIVEIPYESKDEVLLHDCLLQKLSVRNSGLINLCCDAVEIASNLYSLDVPIWAPYQIGDQLLQEQKDQINELLPESQRKFMRSAEPWAICTRVYNIEGRWVVWRVIDELKELDKYMKKENTIPLNFHFFTNLKHSNLFPTLAAPNEGELIVGIFDENEEENFFGMLENLNSSYLLDSSITPKTISISKEVLEDFGILPYSVKKFLRRQVSHLHSSTISTGVFEQIYSELARFTKKSTVQTDKKHNEYREQLADEFLEFSRGGANGILRLLRPISREKRLEYKIYGGNL